MLNQERNKMKILLTADLHYQEENREAVVRFVQEINKSNADVLVIAGDVSGGTALTVECLEQFREFNQGKYIIAGNHDLWTESEDSFKVHSLLFPKLAGQCGFQSLDQKPVILGQIGLVGTIGWYDYSLRQEDLKIPMKYYKDKSLPGIATWADKYFIHWEFTDSEFVDYTLQRLKQQIEAVYAQVESIVCVFHHLPFVELLPDVEEKISAFFYAFAGSKKFGELLLQYEKVHYVYCGHTHRPKKVKKGDLQAINIGSRRSKRRFETLNL